MASLTIEEHRSRLDEIRTAIKELDTEYAGQVLPDEKRAEWNKLNDELEAGEATVKELEARADRIASLSRDGKAEDGADRYQVRTNAGSTRGGDIYDLTSLRSMPPEEQKQELRDRALRSVEKARFGGEGSARSRRTASSSRATSPTSSIASSSGSRSATRSTTASRGASS
jgi:hypothetical protein